MAENNNRFPEDDSEVGIRARSSGGDIYLPYTVPEAHGPRWPLPHLAFRAGCWWHLSCLFHLASLSFRAGLFKVAKFQDGRVEAAASLNALT